MSNIDWDKALERAKQRERLCPGEVRKAELLEIIRSITELGEWVDRVHRDDGPGCDSVCRDFSLLMAKGADKLRCLLGSGFDFRNELSHPYFRR